MGDEGKRRRRRGRRKGTTGAKKEGQWERRGREEEKGKGKGRITSSVSFCPREMIASISSSVNSYSKHTISKSERVEEQEEEVVVEEEGA